MGSIWDIQGPHLCKDSSTDLVHGLEEIADDGNIVQHFHVFVEVPLEYSILNEVEGGRSFTSFSGRNAARLL